MKLIKPSFEIYEQGPGLEGIYEAIERAGRTCYKSTRPEGQTAKDFVDRMIASQHYAMLEHGTVYLKTPAQYNYDDLIRFYSRNPYSRVFEHKEDYKSKEWKKAGFYITTNLRVLVENNKLEDLKLLCEPTEFHEKRVTVRFTSNIHFYKDITRHRKMSFAIESTRYCNYSKGKFGNELTFIIPAWLDKEEISIDTSKGFGTDISFFAFLGKAERHYLELINQGWQAQQAAEILPQATKADIIMTGFVSDWQHVFNLRTSIIAATGKPHPEVSRLMDPLYEEFETRKLI